MRVAWVTFDFEEYSSLHVNAMAQDHDVLLVMPGESDFSSDYEISDDVTQYRFCKPRLRQPLRQLNMIRKILSRVKKFDPDVVHFQQGHLWFNFALRFLKRYPLLITVHDPRHHSGDEVSRKTPQWVIDHGFRQADHVIVHGEALAADVGKLFDFAPHEIHVIPHVAMGRGKVDLPDVQENPNEVLFFGRIWEYKGLDFLIDAAPLIAQQCPDVKIVIGGEGEDFDRYRKRMTNPDWFDIQNRWISDEERAEMFARCALVVLPYVDATQSGVVPVANNFGKPVVATRVGALAECVDHEVTGLLVPPRDPRSLADAIVRMLKDPAYRHELGAAAKQKIEDESSPAVVAAQTLRSYELAIADRQAPSDRQLLPTLGT